MKIKYKAPLIVLLTAFVLTAISAYMNYQSNYQLISGAMQTELRTVSELAQSLIVGEATGAAAQAAMVTQLPPVKEAMKTKDRDALIKLMVPAYNVLHQKFHVVQGHFHVPPATSLLRVRNPEKYGDDLSKDREMVLKANKEKRGFQGLEISSTGMNIRGIEVIKDNDEHLGTFESQVNFSSVIEDLKRVIGYDSGVFINDQLMNKVATLAEKPDPERIIGGYRNTFATDWKKVRPAATADLLNSVNEILYKIETINGQLYGIVVVPLLDFKGAQLGSLVSVRSFHHYQQELMASLVESLGFGFLQAVVLAGVLLIVIRVFLLGPMETIDQKFKDLFKGQLDVDVSALSASNDEIGSLAKNVETLKEKLIKEKEIKEAAFKTDTAPKVEGVNEKPKP